MLHEFQYRYLEDDGPGEWENCDKDYVLRMLSKDFQDTQTALELVESSQSVLLHTTQTEVRRRPEHEIAMVYHPPIERTEDGDVLFP